MQNLHLIDQFISTIETPNTIRTYKDRLSCYGQWLEKNDKDLLSVSETDVLDFLKKYKTPRTHNLSLIVINLLYRYLRRQKLITDNPVKEVERRKVPVTIPDPLKPEEVNALLETSKDLKFRIPILLMLRAGLRLSEALNVRKNDLYKEGDTLFVKVVFGKGGKERETYIANTEAQKEIEEYIEGLKDKQLLSNASFSVMEKYATRVIKKIPIENFIYHRLRKTFACDLADAGESKEQVQVMLGHSSITTTEIYYRSRLKRVGLKMVG